MKKASSTVLGLTPFGMVGWLISLLRPDDSSRVFENQFCINKFTVASSPHGERNSIHHHPPPFLEQFHTQPKTNMEPENHHFKEEYHLPNLHFGVPAVSFQEYIPIFFLQKKGHDRCLASHRSSKSQDLHGDRGPRDPTPSMPLDFWCVKS